MNFRDESSCREVILSTGTSVRHTLPTQPLGRQLGEKLNFVLLSGECKAVGIVSVKERKKPNSAGQKEGSG